MKRKVHQLLSSATQRLFALAMTVFSFTVYSQTTYTFSYTGGAQTLALSPGTYTIETWGADGGDNLGNGGTTFLQNGGKGGYSIGVYTLASATTAYIHVGGRGVNSTTVLSTTVSGGYNGGGYGSLNTTAGKSSGAGGGGASHVATASGTLGALATNQSAVLVVGGGGGGAGESNYVNTNTQYNSNGGNGGGLSGLQIVSTGYQGRHGKGGTQTAGGTGGDNGSAVAGVPLQGIFGAGGYNPISGNNTSTGGAGIGGGGGGWYGGGAGWGGAGTAYCAGAGGGGSGYVGGVSTGTTINFGQPGFVTNPDVSGNGMVIITELCSITLAASNTTLSNITNPAICSGQSLTLTTNAISNYSWSTGATTSSLVVAPTTSTVYTLTAMSPSNCTTSRTISVTVSGGQPTLSVVSSTNQTCLGKTATLTASGALTYTWTNGVSNGVSFYPSTTTTYTVTGQNGCGTVTAVSTISVNPLAVTAASSASAVCTNQTATLSVTAAANSYTWNPGNITGASPNLIVNPQSNTNYTITVSDGTCSGVGTVSVQANPVPTISALASSTIVCPGGTVGLSATGGINYTWTPVNMNGAAITVSPQTSTLFNVTGDNSFGCLNNASQVIVVGTTPTLVLSSNSPSICGGGSATLTVSGADTYAWAGGPTTTVYVVNPTANTTYTVTGTNSSSGCSDTKNIDIGVFTPTISVSGGTAVCAGNQVNLAASGGNSYTWSPGSLQFPSIQVVPVATTIYTVDALAAQGILNCPGSTTFQVIVNPNPTVTTTSVKPAICAKETNTYSASGASTYTWTSNAGTVVGPTIAVTSSVATIVAYTVTGTNAQGCSSDNSIFASIYACTGIDQLTKQSEELLAYPNPSHGEFTLRAERSREISLINELGQVVNRVYLNEDNNYTAKTPSLPVGVYFVLSENIRQKVVVLK